MAVRVFDKIHRLYREVIVEKTVQFPVLTSQLPFFILALKNIRERKEDFLSNSRLVWKQLTRLLQDLQAWETKQPTINLIELTELTRLLIGLLERKNLLEGTAEPVATESELHHLVEILVDQARKILTFVLGQLHCLQELIVCVPKDGEDFLHFLPRKELQDIDEEGDYHSLVKEIGDVSFSLNKSLLHFQKTILEDIQALALYLTLINRLYPLQSLRPEIIKLSRRLNQLQLVKKRAAYNEPVLLENILLRVVQAKFRRVVALANQPSEEVRLLGDRETAVQNSAPAEKQANIIGRGHVAKDESVTAHCSRCRSQPQRLHKRPHNNNNTGSPGATLGNFS
jgi:hypothetical protein